MCALPSPGLVGRDEAIERALRAFDSPSSRGVLVVGERGTGSTALLTHLANRLRRTGRAVVAPLPSTLTTVAAELGGGRVVLVDDLEALDRPAVAAVETLLIGGAVQLLVAARRAGGAISELAETLLRTGSVSRVDLDNLSTAHVDQLATSLLGGDLDHESLDRLHRLTAGNPLRLCRALPCRGGPPPAWFRSHDGLFRFDADAAAHELGPRLVADVWPGIDEATRDVIAYITRIRAAPLNVLLDHFEAAQIARAEATALVASTSLARSIDTVTPSAITLSAADPLGVEQTLGGDKRTATRTDELLLSTRRVHQAPGLVAARADVLTRRGSLGEDDVDDVITAASLARTRGELAAALRLVMCVNEGNVSQSMVSSPRWHDQRVAAAIVKARVLGDLGRHEEAMSAIDGLGPDRGARVATTRAQLHIARSDPVAATTALDAAMAHPSAVTTVCAERASILAIRGEPAAALEALPAEAFYPPVLPRVIGTIGAALAFTGRPLTGVAKSRQATSCSEHSAGDLVEVLCLTEAGHIAEAQRAGRTRYNLALRVGDRWRQAGFALLLAQSELLTGVADQARRWFAESAIVFGELRQTHLRARGLAGAAVCACHVGDVDAGFELAASYDECAPGDAVFSDPKSERLRAMVDVLAGDLSAGVDRLTRTLARATSSGHRVAQLSVAFDLVRLGVRLGHDVVDAFRDLQVEGELLDSRRRVVLAAAAADVKGMIVADQRVQAIGCLGPALEATAHAAQVAAQSGNEQERRRCLRRGNELAARGVHYRLPGSATLASASVCTARELEVARLAAAGVERRAIAADLFISRRTVDRHLNAVFAKLGVSNRTELSAALGRRP